ncbi:choice-of-anchor J domain-containing protein [Flavobacterium sp. JP2137]|uniref:choice-of-anchor J domain-containing protein n=1 Tax=Flavobacterium sp. JP2137 TaxID=3414510 RepID=UPI003D2FA076
MNLKLVLLGIVAFSGIALSAQTIVFQEGFEIGNTGDWKVLDVDGDANNWGIYGSNDFTVSMGFDGRFVGSASTKDSEALTPDNILISPLISLAGKNDVKLSFKVGALSTGDFAENYSVYVVVDSEYNSVTDFLTFLNSKTPVDSNRLSAHGPFTKQISIDEFKDEEVRILFRHHDCTNMYVIGIDDVVVTAGTAKVNEALASKFSFYPNPVTELLHFNQAGNILVSKITVSDINGRTVLYTDLKQGMTDGELDVSKLQAGVYLLTISTNEGVYTKKIIKK